MTSKERVKSTLYREKTDRVPFNYFSNPGIDQQLKNHFGLKKDDDEELRQILEIDIRSIGAPYKGPRLTAFRTIHLWRTCWPCMKRERNTGNIRKRAAGSAGH
jgi:hypothetical protein